MSIGAIVRGRTVYSQNIVEATAYMVRNILVDEFYLDRDFVSYVEIAEKCGSKFCKPINPYEDRMYVFVGGWRLVGQDRGKVLVEKPVVFGETLDVTTNFYAPAPNAAHKVVTPEGLVLAEVIENNVINILFDIFALPIESRKATLTKIFADILVNFYHLDIDAIRAENEIKKQVAVKEFLQEIASREVVNSEREVSRIIARIRDVENNLEDLIRERREAMAKVEGYRLQAVKGAETLEIELNKVFNIDRVESIDIDGQARELVVRTKDIFITNAGKRYYIGKFDIRIQPATAEVKFINLNNKRRSYWGIACNHPHVDMVGKPCWGNVRTAVVTYIRENEYQALVTLLIGFLESVNTSDPAGKNITSWDVVNNAGIVIQKGYDYRYPPQDVNVYTCFGCQDVFSRDNIAMTRGNVHICRECSDNYFACSECNDIHPLEDGVRCEECGTTLICEDCFEDSTICGSCTESARVAEQLDVEGNVLCRFCNSVISENELYTCETCGDEGCGNCITFDGKYSCPNHR